MMASRRIGAIHASLRQVCAQRIMTTVVMKSQRDTLNSCFGSRDPGIKDISVVLSNHPVDQS